MLIYHKCLSSWACVNLLCILQWQINWWTSDLFILFFCLFLIFFWFCFQKCFPSKASINVVYVLKPQGFFQKYSKPSFVADGSLRDSKTKVRSKRANETKNNISRWFMKSLNTDWFLLIINKLGVACKIFFAIFDA